MSHTKARSATSVMVKTRFFKKPSAVAVESPLAIIKSSLKLMRIFKSSRKLWNKINE